MYIDFLINNDFAKPRNFQPFNAMKENNTGKLLDFKYIYSFVFWCKMIIFVLYFKHIHVTNYYLGNLFPLR